MWEKSEGWQSKAGYCIQTASNAGYDTKISEHTEFEAA